LHEAHTPISGTDSRPTVARPEQGWHRAPLRDNGIRREYPDTLPQTIKLIDAAGRSCLYVPITQNGRVVDSLGAVWEQEEPLSQAQ
jgi:hypothetical protein